jgi:hypothetical protein
MKFEFSGQVGHGHATKQHGGFDDTARRPHYCVRYCGARLHAGRSAARRPRPRLLCAAHRCALGPAHHRGMVQRLRQQADRCCRNSCESRGGLRLLAAAQSIQKCFPADTALPAALLRLQSVHGHRLLFVFRRHQLWRLGQRHSGSASAQTVARGVDCGGGAGVLGSGGRDRNGDGALCGRAAQRRSPELDHLSRQLSFGDCDFVPGWAHESSGPQIRFGFSHSSHGGRRLRPALDALLHLGRGIPLHR